MLGIVITLILIGLALWASNTYIPMQAGIKRIINIVVVICVVLWLLSIFGVFAYMSNVSVPRIHR
jgi:hypothetical protein